MLITCISTPASVQEILDNIKKLPKIHLHVESDSKRCAEMMDTTLWSKDFSWSQLQILSRYFEPYSIKKGGIVFDEGDAGGAMSLLVEGALGVQKNNKTLTKIPAGRTYGEMSLIDNECSEFKLYIPGKYLRNFSSTIPFLWEYKCLIWRYPSILI